KSLGEVDSVEVDLSLGPMGAFAMDAGCQVEQPLVPGAVVEPVNAFEVIADARLRPAADEVALGHATLPAKIARHEGQDTRVLALLVKRLQDIEHDHVRPDVGFALERGPESARPEPAVLLLARQHSVDPLAGVLDDALVL